MKTAKFLGIIMMLIMGMAFTACSSDDDEEGDGGSSPETSIVGRTFKCVSENINDEGNKEKDVKEITFVTSSSCSILSWGYYYYWDDDWKRGNYNETKSCSYSRSGDKITLYNYPFYAFGGNKTFTYKGSYLIDEGNDIFKEVE